MCAPVVPPTVASGHFEIVAKGSIQLRAAENQHVAHVKEGLMKYTVIIEKGRESGFVAQVPALQDCVSQGETREDAVANVGEAIEVYI